MTTSISGNSSYWDIDDILAEEEQTPVTNLLDFRFLAHLDPDYVHISPKARARSVSRSSADNRLNDEKSERSSTKESRSHTKVKECKLKEGTRFKMPLWAIREWATTGLVHVSFPKHYGRRAREKICADPISIDLRKRNEHFFMSGISFIDLIQDRVRAIQSSISTSSGSSRTRRQQTTEITNLTQEARELKQTLLLTYTGERMRRTFDWTCSNIEEDVSEYTGKLTVMERKLFARGAAASHAFMMWKLHGSRRIHVSETALKTNVLATSCPTSTHNGEDSQAFNKRDRANSPKDVRSQAIGNKRSRMMY